MRRTENSLHRNVKSILTMKMKVLILFMFILTSVCTSQKLNILDTITKEISLSSLDKVAKYNSVETFYQSQLLLTLRRYKDYQIITPKGEIFNTKFIKFQSPNYLFSYNLYTIHCVLYLHKDKLSLVNHSVSNEGLFINTPKDYQNTFKTNISSVIFYNTKPNFEHNEPKNKLNIPKSIKISHNNPNLRIHLFDLLKEDTKTLKTFKEVFYKLNCFTNHLKLDFKYKLYTVLTTVKGDNNLNVRKFGTINVDSNCTSDVRVVRSKDRILVKVIIENKTKFYELQILLQIQNKNVKIVRIVSIKDMIIDEINGKDYASTIKVLYNTKYKKLFKTVVLNRNKRTMAYLKNFIKEDKEVMECDYIKNNVFYIVMTKRVLKRNIKAYSICHKITTVFPSSKDEHTEDEDPVEGGINEEDNKDDTDQTEENTSSGLNDNTSKMVYSEISVTSKSEGKESYENSSEQIPIPFDYNNENTESKTSKEYSENYNNIIVTTKQKNNEQTNENKKSDKIYYPESCGDGSTSAEETMDENKTVSVNDEDDEIKTDTTEQNSYKFDNESETEHRTNVQNEKEIEINSKTKEEKSYSTKEKPIVYPDTETSSSSCSSTEKNNITEEETNRKRPFVYPDTETSSSSYSSNETNTTTEEDNKKKPFVYPDTETSSSSCSTNETNETTTNTYGNEPNEKKPFVYPDTETSSSSCSPNIIHTSQTTNKRSQNNEPPLNTTTSTENTKPSNNEIEQTSKTTSQKASCHYPFQTTSETKPRSSKPKDTSISSSSSKTTTNTTKSNNPIPFDKSTSSKTKTTKATTISKNSVPFDKTTKTSSERTSCKHPKEPSKNTTTSNTTYNKNTTKHTKPSSSCSSTNKQTSSKSNTINEVNSTKRTTQETPTHKSQTSKCTTNKKTASQQTDSTSNTTTKKETSSYVPLPTARTSDSSTSKNSNGDVKTSSSSCLKPNKKNKTNSETTTSEPEIFEPTNDSQTKISSDSKQTTTHNSHNSYTDNSETTKDLNSKTKYSQSNKQTDTASSNSIVKTPSYSSSQSHTTVTSTNTTDTHYSQTESDSIDSIYSDFLPQEENPDACPTCISTQTSQTTKVASTPTTNTTSTSEVIRTTSTAKTKTTTIEDNSKTSQSETTTVKNIPMYTFKYNYSSFNYLTKDNKYHRYNLIEELFINRKTTLHNNVVNFNVYLKIHTFVSEDGSNFYINKKIVWTVKKEEVVNNSKMSRSSYQYMFFIRKALNKQKLSQSNTSSSTTTKEDTTSQTTNTTSNTTSRATSTAKETKHSSSTLESTNSTSERENENEYESESESENRNKETTIEQETEVTDTEYEYSTTNVEQSTIENHFSNTFTEMFTMISILVISALIVVGVMSVLWIVVK
eukprot:GAHX01000635.1.p1 GENE.GAHX01000635.1~~GAHX01000635.1.p1  ORF type:complete len:1373 (+),score=296.60 GAHX01000635.1:1150-5268(+)